MFFSNKKRKFNFLLLLVDILAVAMIVVIALFVIWLFPDSSSEDVAAEQTYDEILEQIDVGDEVTADYLQSINDLEALVEEKPAATKEQVAEVKEKLFSMRVPERMKDDHLEAVLIIGRLQEMLDSMQEKDLKGYLIAILQELKKK